MKVRLTLPGLTLLPAQLREALRGSAKRPTPALTPRRGEPPCLAPRTYLLHHSQRAFTRICPGWLVRSPLVALHMVMWASLPPSGVLGFRPAQLRNLWPDKGFRGKATTKQVIEWS